MVPGEQAAHGSGTPELRPPGSRPEAVAAAAATHWGLWLALAAVAILGLLVIFALPQVVPEQRSDADKHTPAAQRPEQAGSISDSILARTEAEKTLQGFLHLRAKLELGRAAGWGEPAWSQSAALATAGDRLFGERSFSDAAQSYAEAVRMLEDLQQSRDERLAAALAAADSALQSDDSRTAREQFELALLIEPEQQQAQAGLARAQVRDDVLATMHRGRDAEARGDLESARRAYLQAVQLDGDYPAASAALAQVEQQLTDTAFRAAMSGALTALDSGRLDDAESALQQAASLNPDDAAVQNARQRLLRARQEARLGALRREAAASARAEDWSTTVRLYRQALKVDAAAGFARDGLTQAQERLRLHQQFDHYLADASRLYSAEPLANAKQLLSVAGQAPASEPRLARKIATLRQEVTRAQTPVDISLQSDGETEVLIYHVGRLGRFLDKQLELRPGTYTVVGSRPGYRDVRRVIRIEPGSKPTTLRIACEEAI